MLGRKARVRDFFESEGFELKKETKQSLKFVREEMEIEVRVKFNKQR